MRCVHMSRPRASPRPHTRHCPLISVTRPSIHCFKMCSLLPILCMTHTRGWEGRETEDMWAVWKPEQRDKGVRRKGPGLGSQAGPSLPPGPATYQDVTSTLSLCLPPVRWTVRGRRGESLRPRMKQLRDNRALTLAEAAGQVGHVAVAGRPRCLTS